MDKICVTGANGFIGRNLYQSLSDFNKPVIGTVRSKKSLLTYPYLNFITIGDICLNPNWGKVLNNCKYVVHCAAKAHIFNEHDLKKYRLVNVNGTKKLAEQCAIFGVKRLIFLSSIGVLGLHTTKQKPFLFSDKPKPVENYAISKFEAEQALFEISKKTGLEVVVIRSPYVYGPSAPGNLKRLMNFVKYKLPLPFSLINNQRSFIGVDNLVSLLIRCIEHPEASGKIFLASDGEDLSTPDLINHIASAMGHPATLFPFPISLLKLFGFITGNQKEMSRLLGSLQIDISHTRKILNWSPTVSVKEGIRRMVQNK